jgi:stage II sporulation protein D
MSMKIDHLIWIGLIVLCAPIATIHAEELSRSDKLKVLYSNQFAFDRRGVPIVTVRIAETATDVVIEASSALRVLPDGEDGSEVVAGKRWRVALDRARAAVVEHFVVLAREPVSALTALRQQTATWQKRGARCRLIETGTVFGVKGTVFDNRAYVLADGPYPSRKDALAKAEGYVRQHGLAKVATIPQLKRRPTGSFEAVDADGTARVRARDAMWFAPLKGETLTVRTRRDKARAYWGQIYVTVDVDGTLAVVNAVPADKLLAGLVPSEIFPQAPAAALRAQAVAARGELLAKIGTQHIADPYLLCSTQHCQVYGGAGQENPRTTEAVSATRGMVLVRKGGNLVDTVYSASCGGHSEHNDNVWPVKADPNLRGHLDAAPGTAGLEPFRAGVTDASIAAWLAAPARTYCGRSRFNRDKYRWTVRLAATKVTELVKRLGVGPVKQIRVLRRGVSGRVNLLEVEGALGKQQVRGELDIRRLFGGLRSSMFIVQAAGGDFVFKGGGWGHGVGMCQTGAIGMAADRKSFQEILLHYYPGSEIKTLY